MAAYAYLYDIDGTLHDLVHYEALNRA